MTNEQIQTLAQILERKDAVLSKIGDEIEDARSRKDQAQHKKLEANLARARKRYEQVSLELELEAVTAAGDQLAASRITRKINDIRAWAVEGNLGLVKVVVKKFDLRGGRLEWEDLEQSGLEALMVAWNQWSPDKSLFGHYAMNYIRGSVGREVQLHEFPTMRYDDYCARPSITEARDQLRRLADAMGRPNYDPTFEEIATASGKTVGQVKKVLTTGLVSLSAPLGEGFTLGDTLEVAAPVMVALDVEASLALASKLLEDKHIQAVFTLICTRGLDGSPRQTIGEAATVIGVNRESLRRRLRTIEDSEIGTLEALFN